MKALSIALRAKIGIIHLQTTEELRADRVILDVVSELKYEKILHWSATRGVVDAEMDFNIINDATRDPSTAIKSLLAMTGRVVLIAHDLLQWANDPIIGRTLKEVHAVVKALPKENAKQIIIVDGNTLPPSLTGINTISLPLPDKEILSAVVDSFLEWSPDEAVKDIKKNDRRNKVIGALAGLTAEDAAGALSKSLAEKGIFDPEIIGKEKERIVKGSGLEWCNPDPKGLDSIGGLNVLKSNLMERSKAFTMEAQKYGLPAPSGVMLVGVPGCGKSQAAKAFPAAWGLPLLRMDVGALFSKFVGDSEEKIRKALATAEAVAPCVLWVDEIEKAFGGGGESDGGTSQRVLGTFLTWMQERKPGVFIIATSNDISKLPPEFCRAGRWDDTWFVDLPNQNERKEIAEVMRKRFPHCDKVKTDAVALSSDGNTGAEIEQAFKDALYVAFSDNKREVTTADVEIALGQRIPLIKSAQEKINELRKWAAGGRARFASAREEKKTKGKNIE